MMERNAPVWVCRRRRAGMLVKESRSLEFGTRQREKDLEPEEVARRKKYQRGIGNRTPVDRLEIRLAVLGRSGIHYTLTFDNESLPPDFRTARLRLRAFLSRVRRWKKNEPLDYCYAIEGLHGNHRYHIHFVTDNKVLSPAEVRHLWRYGMVDDEPVLRVITRKDLKTGKIISTSQGGYRKLARYLNKERTDGSVIPIGRHPWGCSRSLNAKVPPEEMWQDCSGGIKIPENVLWSSRGGERNDFGVHRYASWIEDTH